MRRVIPLLLAAALGPSAAFFVACGDRNNLIPSSNADAIKGKLDSVADAANRGSCGRARAAASAAKDEARKLPGNVDSKLRSTIDDGVGRVVSQAENDCTQSTASTQSTATTRSTDSIPPTTTETPTTTTETRPAPTTETTTPETNPDTTGGVSPGNGTGNGPGRGNGGSRGPAD